MNSNSIKKIITIAKSNKLTILIILLTANCLLPTASFSQNVGINSTGAAPNASATLDVDAAPGNDKGILIPRIALLATNNPLPVNSPAISLMVYNTATAGVPPNDVIPGFYYWNGTKWIAFGGNGSANWSLTGNAGTVAGTNFIGTTDSVDLAVYTNNTEKARVAANGNVGIGTNTPNTTIDVSGSVAFRESPLTLINGSNDNLNVGSIALGVISGPTAAFSISGISGGVNGRILTLFNSTSQIMTIENQSASSIAANRIATPTGANIILSNTNSVIQLQYSAVLSRWIVISGQNTTAYKSPTYYYVPGGGIPCAADIGSGGWCDLMTKTITTTSTPDSAIVIVDFNGNYSAGAASSTNMGAQLLIDGAFVTWTRYASCGGNAYCTVSTPIKWVGKLGAGSHTIKIQFAKEWNYENNITAYSCYMIIQALE